MTIISITFHFCHPTSLTIKHTQRPTKMEKYEIGNDRPINFLITSTNPNIFWNIYTFMLCRKLNYFLFIDSFSLCFSCVWFWSFSWKMYVHKNFMAVSFLMMFLFMLVLHRKTPYMHIDTSSEWIVNKEGELGDSGGSDTKRKIMRSHFCVEIINQIFSLDTFMLFWGVWRSEKIID